MPALFANSVFRRAVTGVSLAALSVLLLFHFVISPVQVEGSSMLPSLAPSQRILVSPLIARLGLHRNDIVVIRHPEKPGESLVKRIMGLPGEVIELKESQILINGIPQETFSGQPFEDCAPLRIPAGHFFVLGDNLSDSLDSRAFGPIPARSIRGKAVFSYWPFSRLGIPR